MSGLPRITIVGGGIAGWMAAAAFAHAYGDHGEIRLIDLPEAPGEFLACATLPSLRTFNAQVGLDDVVLLRKAEGVFSLGTRFSDWLRPGHSFFRPFGSFGTELDGVAFHQMWLRLGGTGDDLADYSLAAAAAGRGRFMPPSDDPRSVQSSYDYALNADAAAYAALLRDYALTHGVHRHASAVARVGRDGESGDIESLTLTNGEHIGGDLFLDCSGAAGLLIAGALTTEFEDWGALLPCDRVIAGSVSREESPPPCATVSALDVGWRWSVPVQARTQFGHHYCSAWQSDADALTEFGAVALEAAPVRISSGRRKRAWNANCVAIGTAAGFIDPLGTTTLHQIYSGISTLLSLLPRDRHGGAEAAEFNRLQTIEQETVRDFSLLLLSHGARPGTPLWHHFRTMKLPDSLSARIELFQARGSIARSGPEPFTHAEWLALLVGLELTPSRHHPFADAMPIAELKQRFALLRAVVAEASEAMPNHRDFIARRLAESQ